MTGAWAGLVFFHAPDKSDEPHAPSTFPHSARRAKMFTSKMARRIGLESSWVPFRSASVVSSQESGEPSGVGFQWVVAE